jgi:hypothetical protein
MTPIYVSERTNGEMRGWMGILSKLNAHSDSFPLVSTTICIKAWPHFNVPAACGT